MVKAEFLKKNPLKFDTKPMVPVWVHTKVCVNDKLVQSQSQIDKVV